MIQWRQGPRHQDIKKTQRARVLRRQMTDAERKFWRLLRNRELLSYKFRRQTPFGPYFLDFYCAEKCIAVELDGGQHFTHEGRLRDAKRDKYLSEKNVKVLRYSDRDVLLNPAGVIENLMAHLGIRKSSPQPSPLQGEGGLRRDSFSRRGGKTIKKI